MARGARDIDALTDEELDAELASLDKNRPTEHQLVGGAPRSYGWLVIVTSVIGLFASVQLGLSTMELLRDPFANLACDLNPFIGCGSFLMARQGHILFGFPNPYLGMIAFAILLGLGLALVTGSRLARGVWWAILAGVLAASALVVWFMTQAFFVFNALCPWCVVIWVAMVPLLTGTLARAVQGGHLPVRGALARFLVNDRWLLTALLYVAMLVAIVIRFWDQWLLMINGAL